MNMNGKNSMLRLITIAASLTIFTTVASAKPVRCLIEVDHKVYLNKVCNADFFGEDGSFSIGTGHNPSPYFAYVHRQDKRTADGSWNADPQSTHAHTDLGLLVRHGECWVNKHAKICASKIHRK